MEGKLRRRDFLGLVAGGGLACLAGPGLTAFGARRSGTKLVSPGCRTSKVKVARIFMGTDHGLWPRPDLDLKKEVQRYKSKFAEFSDELSDVDFPVDALVKSPKELEPLKSRLQDVDGILAIHLNIGVRGIVRELLAVGKPTTVFAVPYSGHEWVGFGRLQDQELGSNLACKLTSDYSQLAAAIRPFRAIHHLREAKILDLTTRFRNGYADQVKKKFGTEITQVKLDRVLKLCDAVDDEAARVEAQRWIENAEKVMEPTEKEIFKSAKLALAFERLLDEEQATVMTADCYGSMYKPLCKSYAFPCLGFARLNDMGLGGICESDLSSAMTHIIFQGLTGKPGFISDPTIDESDNTIILAHCLGTPRMDGPDGPMAPYNLRCVMERRDGVVTQVTMRHGQPVTQAILVGTSTLPYFTGEIVETPHIERGCRTKATAKIDGDATTLWKNWSAGLHRVTVYGDIIEELEDFCRFAGIEMINEAV